MNVSLLDNAMHRCQVGDAELGRPFSNSAEVRARMLSLGSLASVQGPQA